MTQSCGVTGGPEWLFDLVLGGGLVAFVYGLVWVLLLVLQGKPSESGYSKKRLTWNWVLLALLAVLLVPPLVGDPVGALIYFSLAAPAVVTLYVVLRRARVEGVMPPARSAPLGMFWVLVAVSVLALLVSVTAFVVMFALGHSVPC